MRHDVMIPVLVRVLAAGALALFGADACSGGTTTACGECPGGTVCDPVDLQCHSLCNDIADCNSGQKCCSGVCRRGACPNDDTFDPCSVIVCGNHATCVVVGGAAQCHCDDGYQDADSDRTCLPTCVTAALECHGHGTCAIRAGTAQCICDAQHTGSDCLACAAAYQDSDSDGTCLPTCAASAINCHGHGTCSYVAGHATCRCETEYDGTDCLSCATNYQDSDDNGTCLLDCISSNLNCHGHGSCGYVEGAATCICDPAYTGPGCQDCHSGYVQWPANSGTCVDDPCSPSPCPNPTGNYHCVQTGVTTTQCLCAPHFMVQSGGTGACIASPCVGATVCPGWFCHGSMPTCRQGFMPAAPVVLHNAAMFGAYTALKLADLDGDGVPEIFAGQHDDSNQVDIWTYEGGSFSALLSTPGLGDSVHEIAVGDFNEDGFPDIVTATRWNAFMYVQNNGDGSWVNPAYMTDPASWGYAHALWGPVDLNGDGHLDVIVDQDQEEWLYYGDGNGGFVGSQLIGADGDNTDGAASIRARGPVWPVDLDHDGDVDLVGVWAQGGWSTYPNDHVDFFMRAFRNLRAGPQTAPAPFGVALGQFYGSWFGAVDDALSSGTGYRLEPNSYSFSGVGDFNEDGVVDMVAWNCPGANDTTTNNPPYELGLYTGRHDGSSYSWQRTVQADISNGTNTVVANITVTDINKDGHLDIIVGHLRTANGMTIFYGYGNGTFLREDVNLQYLAAPFGVGADRDPAGVFDYDGDGLLELVWCAYQGTTDLGVAVLSQTPF